MIKTSHLYKRFQVFISSTYLDLKSERDAVKKSLNKNNYIVEGMELFPAANKKQWHIITERINYSDIYVLIIGDRYGSLVQNPKRLEKDLTEQEEVISYTHMEYRYAKKAGIPILVFIKANRIEDERVNSFIQEIQSSNLTTAIWEDQTDLVTDILAGLSDTTKDSDYVKNNGWVKVKSLNIPIDAGNKEVYSEIKIRYVKFISYIDKNKKPNPLYKKFIQRLNKEVDVWDEYVTINISNLSHYVEGLQLYARTDGDAIDFSALLPFLNKEIHFSDRKGGEKDKVYNPLIDSPSNTYVDTRSVINGFQDGSPDLAVKATQKTRRLVLIVDFTSIPDFDKIFSLKSSTRVDRSNKGKPYTIEGPKIPQKGIYILEQENLDKDTVLELKFKIQS